MTRAVGVVGSFFALVIFMIDGRVEDAARNGSGDGKDGKAKKKKKTKKRQRLAWHCYLRGEPNGVATPYPFASKFLPTFIVSHGILSLT